MEDLWSSFFGGTGEEKIPTTFKIHHSGSKTKSALHGMVSKGHIICTLNTDAECILPLEVLKSLDNNHPLRIHAIIDVTCQHNCGTRRKYMLI